MTVNKQENSSKNDKSQRVYIYLKAKDWRNSGRGNHEFNAEEAFKQARNDYVAAFNVKNAVGKASSFQMEREILRLLETKPQLEEGAEQYLATLQQMISGSGSAHMQGIGGINANLHSIAFAGKKDQSKKKFEESMKKVLDSSDDKELFINGLQKIINFIDGAENDLKQLENGKFQLMEGVILDSKISEKEKILQGYNKLKDIIKQDTEGKLSGVDAAEVCSKLRSAGFLFMNNFSGAVNETFNVAYTGAKLLAEDSLQALQQVSGATSITVEVEEQGDSTYDINGTLRRNKGDTLIKIHWKMGKESGTWTYSISEKSSKIQAQSNKIANKINDKSFRGRLVGSASYETIFKGIEGKIQTIFCNMYIHEFGRLVEGDAPVMGFIAARCASNIIAGWQGTGMANALREADGSPLPVWKLFNIMKDSTINKGKANKYISVKMNDEQNAREIAQKYNNDTEDPGVNASRRSQTVYELIRDGVKFSATLGSRQGIAKAASSFTSHL